MKFVAGCNFVHGGQVVRQGVKKSLHVKQSVEKLFIHRSASVGGPGAEGTAPRSTKRNDHRQ